jgi:hypothetical protein
MPERIKALPLDDRGYPIPFFVAYVDGKSIPMPIMDAFSALRNVMLSGS